MPVEIPDAYKPSEWLSEVIPKKFPYYPQMGDEVMFFAQGYELYLKAVMNKRVYVLSSTQRTPWGKLQLKVSIVVVTCLFEFFFLLCFP